MATVTATQTITPGEGNLELELITVPDHAVVEAHDESQPPRNAVSTEEPVSLTLNVKLKLFCAGFSFFFAGTNDGSLGPLIPYLLKDYNISTSSIAILYGLSFCGWLTAAFTNSHVSSYFDFGAILIFGAVLQLIAFALRCWFPPFGLFVFTFFLASLGMSFQDSHANTYVSGVKGAHRWLGFIHAMYGLGTTVSPFVATLVASKDRWPLFYLFPVGIGLVNLVFVVVAFKDSIRLKRSSSTDDEERGRNKVAFEEIKAILSLKSVWILSMFYFFYLGAAITAGGWVVEYLVTVRQGDIAAMGYVSTGFGAGMTLSRLLLAEPTHRFGERRMVFGYIAISIGLQLVFWLVPNIVASAVAVSLMGFFLGPLFATGMSVASKLFPRKVQAAALGLVFVLAQAGGSLFPSLTGLIATRVGVQVLQPILVVLLSLTAINWLLVPKLPNRGE